MKNLQKSLSMNIKLPISDKILNKYRQEAAIVSNSQSKSNDLQDEQLNPLFLLTQHNTGVINT